MQEIIRVNDQFYILAASAMDDDRTRVLKHDETFAVFDRYGDIRPVGHGSQGLYHEGTRFLSRLEFFLNGERPMLLSSTVREDNALLAVDLTNPDVYLEGQVIIPRGTLHIFRSIFLWEGKCFERLRLSNYGQVSVEMSFSFLFDADFSDIFEVRGFQRARRGCLRAGVPEEDSIVLAYDGLDGLLRRSRITCFPRPRTLSHSQAGFGARLDPKEEMNVYVTIACESGEAADDARPSYDQVFARAMRATEVLREEGCHIYTSNEQFNDWLNRSQPDLHMMVTETAHGPYPYAGVPWFSAPFGRDGIIAGLAYLWVNPAIARGVLAYLAATQARETDPARDAEPGKILHEARRGEMAALDEIPFRRYYGTVDATPLFVLLAAAFYERTADLPFLKSIWPAVEGALQWMDRSGDSDRDGFIEYARHSASGLVHQGWKDSHDAVFHADGSLAEGPIALCEVQGYAYAAKRGAATLAAALGYGELADALLRQAEHLRDRFEQVFWCEDLSTYALALDGRKQPCRVKTSNAGHCLFSGIASLARAQRLADLLMSGEFFSGWGIRTLAEPEARYNPISYHNGSVWPHDNALIVSGLARYGFKKEVCRVMGGLFDASLFLDLHRLPELFCGFARRPGQGPTLYPVACAPQAWAAASVFLMLQACLGLSIQADARKISLVYPYLPEFLPEVRVRNLMVGTASVDFCCRRYGQDVGLEVVRREGDVEVVVVQ